MLKELSLTLFHNQELISLLLIEGVILIVSFMIYKSLKKKNEIIKTQSKETSAGKTVWNAFDSLICGTITLMFLVVAFWQLGDTELPHTRWQPTQPNESFVLQIEDGSSAFDRIYLLSGEGDNNALESGYQIGLRNVLIEGSNDLVDWDNISQIDNSSYLQWKIIEGQWNYHYLRITAGEKNNEIGRAHV